MIAPKKRTLYRYAVDTFISLLSQVQIRSKEYRCNDTDVKCWNAFIDCFEGKNIGKDFIFKFCQFGMQCWFNEDMTDTQKNNCRFSWVFSSKSVKRYKSVGGAKGAQYVIRYGLKKEMQVSLTHEIKPHLKKPYTELRKVEEKFKQEFHNTKKGLSWCVSNTTLYHDISPLCSSCIYKEECKEILRQNYYKIYKFRGYDE